LSEPAVLQRLHDEALARRDAIAAEWAGLDAPFLARGSMGQDVPHPLWRMLNEADKLVDSLARSLRPAGRSGRPTGAVSAPDRVAPPRVKLKAVG